MSTPVLRFARITVLVLALTLAFSGCGKKEATVVTSGYDFTLSDLQGEKVSFSDFQGQVIMVNFWAPWCGPCRVEMPDLIDLYDEYKDDGLCILGVTVAFKGEGSGHDFAEQSGITYPVLFGNNEVVKNYGGFRGIPTTFLFSRDGRLYKKYEGMRSGDVFRKDIVELL